MGLVSSSLYVSQLGHVVLKVCCVLILVTFILVCVWGNLACERPEESTGPLRAGDTIGCEPPDIDTLVRPEGLYKGDMYS